MLTITAFQVLCGDSLVISFKPEHDAEMVL
jgi:hypothetical protein